MPTVPAEVIIALVLFHNKMRNEDERNSTFILILVK